MASLRGEEWSVLLNFLRKIGKEFGDNGSAGLVAFPCVSPQCVSVRCLCNLTLCKSCVSRPDHTKGRSEVIVMKVH